MTVRLTSDQVTTLRSYLSGDFAGYEERRGQIDRSPDRTRVYGAGLRRLLRGRRAQV
jgi:hypothetical protein